MAENSAGRQVGSGKYYMKKGQVTRKTKKFPYK